MNTRNVVTKRRLFLSDRNKLTLKSELTYIHAQCIEVTQFVFENKND